MDRIPEPELMDDADQARAYAEADFEEAHTLFATLIGARFGTVAGAVLDLGCGAADPTVRFARANPGAVVTAVDAADAMLAMGAERVAAAGLGGRVRFERVLLPDPALEGRGFDAVISNSLLHHLPDPVVLWRTAAACARPGAPIAVMDLLRPDDSGTVDDLVDRYAAGAPEVLRTDFRNSLRAAYRPDEVGTQLAAAGLDHLDVEQVSDRHLFVSGRR